MSDISSAKLPAHFGKYLLVERIAHGGMAEIFKAKSYGVSGFEKTIVIKRILPSFSDDHELVEMLIDEAKLCAGLQHANVVQIFDLGRLEGCYYIAMEYVNGLDLLHLLIRLFKNKRRLPQELACFILSEALKGLDYAHHAVGADGQPLRIVHRDFNPANILLSFHGEVKVADFGIAKATARNTHTVAGGLKGKMGYLSPEQVVGKEIDHRSDVFTAGITFWEALTCRRMFSEGSELDILIHIRDAKIPDLRRYLPEAPDDLCAIINRSLQRRPEDRFHSASEFREAIDDYIFNNGFKVNSAQLVACLKQTVDQPEDNRRPPNAVPGSTRPTPPNYWIRAPGQPAQGPLQMDKLYEMMAAGQLTKRFEVLRENGSWMHLADVPELAVHLATLPTMEEADPDTVADYQGQIAEISFPKLIYRLAIAQEDGRLVLARQGVTKEIYLRQGMPEFVKSNLPSELLGQYLVDKKIITQSQRDQAIRAMHGFSGRLGDTLIALSIVKPHELFQQLQDQVREKILEVFSWDSGTYHFFSGQTYKGEVIPLKIGSFAIIAEGVRRYVNADVLKARYRTKLDQKLRRLENPYFELDILGLTAREQRVVNSLDGQPTIRDLLSSGGSDSFSFESAIYSVIYILEELEMVEFIS
jgi:serine/threonine protein kinase